MISKIKKLHNTYIIVDMDDYLDERAESQFDKEIAKYVMDHYPKVDSKLHFDVYYKE